VSGGRRSQAEGRGTCCRLQRLPCKSANTGRALGWWRPPLRLRPEARKLCDQPATNWPIFRLF
jgi:hypothetical protein